uniref:DUF4371 domain-containing protein n=1 Tax=Pelodiscus sinensis TaxID=13735 RepID=K7GJS8_PELSI
EDYLKYGFTSTIVNDEPCPKCILCLEILANDSTKPSRLARHLKTKHPEHEDKSLQFFRSCDTQSSTLQNFSKLNDKCLDASFEVSYLIAKDKKPHTIGETLVLPAAVKMVEIIHGKQYGDKLKCFPLSASTVGRRIENIAEDLKKQVLEQIMQCGRFAVQLDENTDVSNVSQLMVFARLCFNNEMHEELLFCVPLKERCTGEDIVSIVNNFFNKNNVLWKNCVSVTTDGAAALTGVKKGFQGKVTESTTREIHSLIIHRQAIAAKKDVIDVVNFIKTRPLNSRIFTILCNEDGEHENLLYHTEVHWLSRGKVLKRVVELKDVTHFSFTKRQVKFADFFCDDKWLSVVCYLEDIFKKISTLNLSLQGKGNFLTMSEKVTAFQKKLVLWREHFENRCLERFPSLCDFVAENNASVSPIKTLISAHLKILETEFSNLFKNLPNEEFQWVLNPFVKHIKILQEQQIDIREDGNLLVKFQHKPLHNWWMRLKNKYRDLVSAANDALLPFGSTYLCEVSFLAITAIKTKY